MTALPSNQGTGHAYFGVDTGMMVRAVPFVLVSSAAAQEPLMSD